MYVWIKIADQVNESENVMREQPERKYTKKKERKREKKHKNENEKFTTFISVAVVVVVAVLVVVVVDSNVRNAFVLVVCGASNRSRLTRKCHGQTMALLNGELSLRSIMTTATATTNDDIT